MNPEQHPANENVQYLRQGIELIRNLEPERYAAVGAHFRHCLDFYNCFLQGVESGKIDYSCRNRDPRVEREPQHAADVFESIGTRLLALDPKPLGRPFQVRIERSENGSLSEETNPECCGSSPLRELQFLVSHTVHHYAIIKLHLQLLGMDVSELADFGVAPSTRAFWQRTG